MSLSAARIARAERKRPRDGREPCQRELPSDRVPVTVDMVERLLKLRRRERVGRRGAPLRGRRGAAWSLLYFNLAQLSDCSGEVPPLSMPSATTFRRGRLHPA